MVVTNYAGEVGGWINGNGDAGTITLVPSSDRRYKENIQDSTYGALNMIDSLKMRQFNWKKSYKRKGMHIDIGLIAQEVQEVDNRFVDDSDEDSLGIYSTEFIYPLLKAVQELSAKLTALEAQIN